MERLNPNLNSDNSLQNDSAREEQPKKMPRRQIRWLLNGLFCAHLLAIFVAPLWTCVVTAYDLFPNRPPYFVLPEPPQTRQRQTPEENGTSQRAEQPRTDRQSDQAEEVTTEAFAQDAAAESQPPQMKPFAALQYFDWYLQATFMGGGYNFFAPNPPTANNIVAYEIELQDGKIIEGRFPDHNAYWPRLRYHRHMMLASQLNGFSHILYAKHLMRKHRAKRVTLKRILHRILTEEQVSKENKRINDIETYQDDGSYTLLEDQLDDPLPWREQ